MVARHALVEQPDISTLLQLIIPILLSGLRAFIDFLIAFHSPPGSKWPARSDDFCQQTIFSAADAAVYRLQPPALVPGLRLHEASAGDWRVWALGEIYQYADAGKTTASRVTAFATDLAASKEQPLHLNGHCLIFAFNGKARQWHVWTDRFATLHTYYGSDGQRAAIGTFHPAVVAASSRRRLDWQGLTGFFGFGFFPQDRTYFEDVRILQPASHYVFDEHGALRNHDRYWAWRHEPDPKRSYDDTVAAFNDTFVGVMRDLLRENRVAIPISGGLDSRTTLAAANGSAGHRLWSYSYGYADDSIETRIAGQLAQARALPFQQFTVQPYLFDKLDEVLAGIEGFQDVTLSRQAFVADEIGQHADYVISAHLGDLWMGDMGLVDQPNADDETVVEYTLQKMQKTGHAWLLQNLCEGRPNAGKATGFLKEVVREQMKPLRHIECPDFRAKAYKRETWSWRWTTASIRMFQATAFPRLAYDDTRLTDLMCTIPSAFVSQRRLQIDFLKRFAPDLARVPWQPYDASLFHYQHFNTWLLPKRAIKKAARLLAAKKIFERNWEVQFLNDRGRKGLQHWLLRPGLKLHEFVAPAKVQELLDNFYVAPLEERRGYTVSMLLTFSAWLEKYA